jgi:hypothetical protein
VTGLTPAKVYCAMNFSDNTGADIYNSAVITCTNGATISLSGIGVIPDHGFKVVGNWVFGSEGMLSCNDLCANTGSDGALGDYDTSGR